MTPILGIMASQISGHLTVANNYESIATTTLSTATATITFSSIPATYKHLQIRGIARSSQSASTASIVMKYNSDAGANYYNHYIYGNSSSVTAGSAATANIGIFVNNGAYANAFSPIVIDILDYANTNKYKVAKAIGGQEDNSVGWSIFRSTLWTNTNAITQIDFTDATGGNYMAYSSFALYGIK